MSSADSSKVLMNLLKLLKIDYLYDCHDITTRYESIMGTAHVEEILDEEKETIMQEKVLSRWEEARAFPWNRESLKRYGMFKLKVQTISEKESNKQWSRFITIHFNFPELRC